MKLSEAITMYLDHKRALGYRFFKEGYILRSFLKRVGNLPVASIEPKAVLSYLNQSGLVTATWIKKHHVISGLFHFMLVHGLAKSSPVPHSIPNKTSPDFVPYIYSHAELKSLLDAIPATTSVRVPIDIDVLRTLILLLYGAGLRLGEALTLTTDEVDLRQRCLSIHDTKFFKNRLVPVGTDLSLILTEHIGKLRASHTASEKIPLFCFRDGSPLSQSAARSAFRRMRLHAGIQREGGSRWQPRLHDLRHTFAVHRLIAWYRSDANLQELLPKLAIYMGHVDLSSTQHYLTMTPELLAQASLRFERYAKGEQS